MKNNFYLRCLICVLTVTTFSFTTTIFNNWKINDTYQVKFSGSSAEGTFKGLKGSVVFDSSDLSTAFMNVSVDVSTISTGNKTKDKHARGKSWFHAEKYPKITFKSTQFNQASRGYEVIGKLTLHGITKEVKIPFTFEADGKKALFVGQFTVNRQDYGIKGPFFGFTVGNEFQIDLRVPVNQ